MDGVTIDFYFILFITNNIYLYYFLIVLILSKETSIKSSKSKSKSKYNCISNKDKVLKAESFEKLKSQIDVDIGYQNINSQNRRNKDKHNKNCRRNSSKSCSHKHQHCHHRYHHHRKHKHHHSHHQYQTNSSNSSLKDSCIKNFSSKSEEINNNYSQKIQFNIKKEKHLIKKNPINKDKKHHNHKNKQCHQKYCHNHRHHHKKKKHHKKHHKKHKNRSTDQSLNKSIASNDNERNHLNQNPVNITESTNLLEKDKKSNIGAQTNDNLTKMSSTNDLTSNLWGLPRHVVLQRQANKSLGISIVGGKLDVCHYKTNDNVSPVVLQTNLNSFISGIFIKHVLDNSPAGINGTLKTGDRILAVNNVDLTNATHDRAVEVIRNAQSPVNFLIQSLICNNYIPTCDENANGNNIDTKINVISSDNVLDKNNDNKINIVKEINSNNSIYINMNKTCLSGNNDENITDPERQITDQSNKFNYSLDLLNEKYSYLFESNNNSQPNTPTKNNNNDENLEKKKDGCILIFKLKRNFINESLGLSLSGNLNLNKTSVFVCGIYKDSIAYKHGLIKVGDQILEINGQCLYGRAHSNVTPLIRNIKDLDIYIVIMRFL